MNMTSHRSLCFRATLIGIGLPILFYSGKNQAMAWETQLSWNSPKMLQIRKDGDSLWNTYRETPEKIPGGAKTKYEAVGAMVRRLLRSRLSDEEVRQLIATCGALPVHSKDRSEFDKEVIWFMVDVCVYARDREQLVRLLSRRFPGTERQYMEFYLVTQATVFKYPILILEEAYSKCQVPEVRRDIAAAVRRGFAGLGIHGKDDADYVSNAMRWYEKEKNHLSVNIRYSFNRDMFLAERYEHEPDLYDKPGVERELLFKGEHPSQETRGSNQEASQDESEALSKVMNWAPLQCASGPEAEAELARLKGTWDVIDVVSDGRPVAKEKVMGYRFVFDKDTLTWLRPDGEKEDEFRFRLGTKQEPRPIDLVRMPRSALKREQTTALVYQLQEVTISAIYELKGDTLRMCIPWVGVWQRPRSFETRKGSTESTFTLKRAKQ